MNRRKFINCALIIGACGTIFPLLSKKTINVLNDNMKNISGIEAPCYAPFEHIQVLGEGNVTACSLDFYDTTLGNIFNDNLYNIWKNKNYQNLREEMLKGNFSRCNRDKCSYHGSNYDKKFNPEKNFPKQVLLCYDQECNYKCITCRDKIFINDKETINSYDKIIIPRILPFLEKAEEIMISGGDPLTSRHTRNLIKQIFKNIKKPNVSLYTQGYFADNQNFNDLGITHLNTIAVSVHSANRKTYEKIMRQDSFNRIMKNLEFLSKMKKEGKIHCLKMNFVLHSMNYKEMVDFVKLAKKYDAIAEFWTYSPWESAEMHKRYKEVAVFEPWHKDYPKLQKILKNPVFKSENCIMTQELQKIALG